jgi:uncharacterized membrane protein YfcA
MIDLTVATITLLVAVVTGILSATVGVGGGFIMVSYMVAVIDYSSQQAVGTSAFVIIFSAISASIAYFRQKRIDYKIGILATLFSVPGAIIGGYATKFIPSQQLAILFSLALFFVGSRMILFPRERSGDVGPKDRKDGPVGGHDKENKKAPDGKLHHRWKRTIVDAAGHKFSYESNIIPSIPFFFLAGILSGLFGIGGGIVIVPALEVVAGFPMHLAVATSMFTMIFTSISSASTHLLLGHVVFDYVIFLIIGIVVGAQFGARAAKRMRGSAIERLFGVTMVMIGIYLIIYKGILGF